MNTRRGCITTGVFALFSASAALAGTDHTLQSPITAVGTQLGGAVTVLERSPDLYLQLHDFDQFTLEDFPLGIGQKTDLNLHAIRVFTPESRIVSARMTADGDIEETELVAPDALYFGGTVAGSPDSWAFLSVTQDWLQGMIQVDGQTYVISDGQHLADLPPVVYNLADIPDGVFQFEQFVCKTDEIGKQGVAQAHDGFTSRGYPCRVAEVAIETDHEYLVDLFGGDQSAATAWAGLLVAAASDVYGRDANVTFNVSFLRLWDSPADPYTSNFTSCIDQLFEFIDYWEANMGSVSRNGAHYFTSRSLGCGVAYLPGLCNPGFAYALSCCLDGSFPYPLQDNHWDNWDVMVVNHEWGHNFGAPHTHDQTPQIDDCANGDCSIVPNATIMSYCHLCAGGLSNVQMRLHPQTVASYIIPYLEKDAPCDMLCPTACAADWNQNGTFYSDDFIAYLNDYNAVRTGGTFTYQNPDIAAPFGTLNSADFIEYLNLYNLGCDG